MKPVEAADVTKRFGSFIAVDSVDLAVDSGEVVGLVGANGAGKTTLMRMVLGLLTPTDGSIRLFGERHSREQRRRIGYVPQNLGLYADLTAAENLGFRADVFQARAITDGLEPGLVKDLPLGVQRRIAFVAATQHDPELLVLDEPTSGVSPLARAVLWELIRERAEQGTAVLVSTHYMDEAEQTDRLVLMSRGSVVARGTVDDVIAGRRATKVTTDSWARAFEVLDRNGHLMTLAGRDIRVLESSPDSIVGELSRSGIEARTTSVPATLDETMVVLES